jgi:hypothetical protein
LSIPLGPNDVLTASAIASYKKEVKLLMCVKEGLYVRHVLMYRAYTSNLPLAAIMLDVRTSFSLAETLNDSPLRVVMMKACVSSR